MADRIDLFDPTVLDELITRIISPDSDAHISGVISNVNGSYFRIGDFQVCFGVTESHAVSVAVGSMQRTNTESHMFPASFLPNEVVVSASPQLEGGNPSGHYVRPNSSGTGFDFRLYAPAAAAARVAFVAVGRWR